MDSKKYQELAANTDHEDYSEISKRLVKYQSEAIQLFKDILVLGIKGDMLKKVIIYGLDPKSEDYKKKMQKHTDALYAIEKGAVSNEILGSDKFARLYHYYLGLNTESAETVEALLNWVTGVKEIDLTNLSEENSDCLWYLARTNDVIGSNFESQMETNIKKLAARYPDKFTGEAALNRNLEKEREILEEGFKPGKDKA